jgi:hypothetical protein
MSISLARNNVSYTVRLRSPNGRRIGFFNGLWEGELPTAMFVTQAKWSVMPPALSLFEKEDQARSFRQSLLDMHIRELNAHQRHLDEQKTQQYYEGLGEYIQELEDELKEAIEMVPYIRDAEIVRIVVERV